MNKILEFPDCKFAIRAESIKAIAIDPDDKKNVKLYIEGVYDPGGFNLHHYTEESAERIYSQIIEAIKDD